MRGTVKVRVRRARRVFCLPRESLVVFESLPSGEKL